MEDLDSVEEGQSGEDLDGGGGRCGEGASVRRGPDDSRRGVGVDPMMVEADAEEERAHSVKPAMVGEVVGEAPTWSWQWSRRHLVMSRRLWRWSRSGRARGWRWNDTNKVRV
jgi:hypothetical protein